MWDIVGKPLETMSKGKDCTGSIIEKIGGVAFNIALGLSKNLNKKSFDIILVSAIGKTDKTQLIKSVLDANNINTKYLIIKGQHNDQYLSIETKGGEIFGSINSSNTFLSNQNDIIKYFSLICSQHKKTKKNAIFIFDGNCTRKLLDYAKTKASDEIFTKYFIPANFSKLTQFKNNAIYFKGFNLIMNLKESSILVGAKNFKNAVEASKAIFEKIKTKKSLIIVTDGPNIVCGVSNEEVAEVTPENLRNNASRSGAGDAFFANFLSYNELNPDAGLYKTLQLASQKTQEYLKADD